MSYAIQRCPKCDAEVDLAQYPNAWNHEQECCVHCEIGETVDIVFDDPLGPVSGRFVEVENEKRASISLGEWVHRDDGYWVLRIPDPRRKARSDA